MSDRFEKEFKKKPTCDDRMSNDLVLVKLSDEQSALARQANGTRLKITHALLCGKYGQMLGTEKQCRKYYSVWKDIFRHLFDRAYETKVHAIQRYQSSANLVMSLIEEDNRIELRRQDKQGG